MEWRRVVVLYLGVVLGLVSDQRHGLSGFVRASSAVVEVRNDVVQSVTSSGVDLSGVFSMDQELGVQYSIGFLPATEGEQGEKESPMSDDDNSIYTMTLHNGTVYRCRAVSEALPSASWDTSDTAVEEEQGEDQGSGHNKSIRSVLNSLGDWCAYRVEGWWTYELCYKKKIRQYHLDSQTQTATEEYVLGKYPDVIEEFNVSDNGTLVDIGVDLGSGRKFVADTCARGDVCDLESVGSLVKQERQIEVRYSCGPSDRPMIMDVQESKICHYIMDVRMSSLCNVTELRTVADLPKRQIECWQA